MDETSYRLEYAAEKASRAYSHASLFIDDSGIELNRRAQLQSGICEVKDEQGIQSDYDIGNKESQLCLNPRDNPSKKKSDCCSDLLWNFLTLKSKIDLASEIMQLQKRGLVKEAERDALSRLCNCKMEIILEDEGDHGRSNYEEDSSARTPNIIISMPSEEELQINPDESATTLARTSMDYTKAEISDLLSEFRAAVDENQCLKKNLESFKSLNEDIRGRYQEYRSHTEKTLAALGEYVMNTRLLQSECDDLQHLLHCSESERKYCMTELKESRMLIEVLQQRVTEVEEAAKFYDKKAADMEKQAASCKFQDPCSQFKPSKTL